MRNVIIKKASPLVTLYLLPPIVKLLLALCTFVFCSALGFYIMHQQSIHQLHTADQRKKTVQEEVMAQAKSFGELSGFTKNASSAQKQYDAFIKLFPSESSMGDLLASITKLGTENGLKFIYFKPLKSDVHGYYASVPVDISVVGTFHHIAKFLSSIANLPGSVVATNQFVLMHTEKNEGGLLTLELKATLYHTVPTSTDVKP